MKKRSYLLLEVLIAFNIFIVACLPLIKIPTALYLEKKKCLLNLEKNRLSDAIFSELYKNWRFKNTFPLKAFTQKNTRFIDWTPLNADIYHPYSRLMQNYPVYYRLKVHNDRVKVRQGSSNLTAMLIDVDLLLDPLLQKTPKENIKKTNTYYVLLAQKPQTTENLPSPMKSSPEVQLK